MHVEIQYTCCEYCTGVTSIQFIMIRLIIAQVLPRKSFHFREKGLLQEGGGGGGPSNIYVEKGAVVNTIRYVLHSFSEVRENMTCVSMPLKTEKQEWGLVQREILRPLYACMYVCMYTLLTSPPLRFFSARLHQVLRLLLTQTGYFLRFYFPICVYPNPPCQLPCGRKPERPEKTQEFRQSAAEC